MRFSEKRVQNKHHYAKDQKHHADGNIKRFGLYLVCDKRGKLRRNERAENAGYHCRSVGQAADSEMRYRTDKRGKRHDKHACADRLFKRKSHKRREYKEHHHATARADESANHTNHCRQRKGLNRVAPFVFVQAVL